MITASLMQRVRHPDFKAAPEAVDAAALSAIRAGSPKEIVLKILALRAEKDRFAPFTLRRNAHMLDLISTPWTFPR